MLIMKLLLLAFIWFSLMYNGPYAMILNILSMAFIGFLFGYNIFTPHVKYKENKKNEEKELIEKHRIEDMLLDEHKRKKENLEMDDKYRFTNLKRRGEKKMERGTEEMTILYREILDFKNIHKAVGFIDNVVTSGSPLIFMDIVIDGPLKLAINSICEAYLQDVNGKKTKVEIQTIQINNDGEYIVRLRY